MVKPTGKLNHKHVKTIHIEKCEVCKEKFKSKILLRQQYQTIHPDAIACMTCTLLISDIKYMRKHLAY